MSSEDMVEEFCIFKMVIFSILIGSKIERMALASLDIRMVIASKENSERIR